MEGRNQSSYDLLISKLDAFIRKYYLNNAIRGFLYWVGVALALLIAYSLLEHFNYFDRSIRKFMFYSYLAISVGTLLSWVVLPLARLAKLGSRISHAQAATIIGTHFSNVEDKLLNVLQLREAAKNSPSPELAFASIEQKTLELKPVPFPKAIDLTKNRKYLRYSLPPLLLLLVLLVAAPTTITDSTKRILNNNVDFERAAPFAFVIPGDEELTVEQYEDYVLDVEIEGSVVPDEAFIQMDGYQFRLKKSGANTFSYKFKNVQSDTEFSIFAGPVATEAHTLKVLRKPNVLQFQIALDYPAYTGRQDNTLEDVGDLVVPEGTRITWDLEVANTDALKLRLGKADKVDAERRGEDLFTYSTAPRSDLSYSLYLLNEQLGREDSIHYAINVIPDAFPKISVEEFIDSLDNKRRYFAGTVSDDYGLRKLTFNYKIENANGETEAEEQFPLTVKSGSQDQFSYGYDFNELILEPGQSVSYYFEVFDNDAINGSKSTKSRVNTLRKKTIEEFEESSRENAEKIKDDLKKSLSESKKIREDIQKLREQLLQEKEMKWQNKKEMEKLLQRKETMQNELNKLEELFEQNMQNEQEISEPTEEQMDKMEKLEELFEELKNEELEEMMEKLSEMMEQMEKKDALEMLENMDYDEEEMQKELDRLMELFKQMEVEQELDKQAQKLNELAEKEEQLSEETEQGEKSNEELKEEQQKIQEELNDVQEKMDDIQEKNKELERPKPVDQMSEEMEKAEQDMQNSQEQLDKQQNQKASESQKSAAQRMRQMAQQMQMQQSQGQMQQMQEDLGALRQLLENLVTLSFDEEDNINALALTNINTPKYVSLVQDQFKIQDDFKVVEDSLHALSKRVVELESFVTEKVTDIKHNLNTSLEYLEERNKAVASENQQRAMTGMNDLALMLSEVMNQMQQQMSSMMPGSQMCSSPKQGQGENSGGVPMDKITEGQKQLNEDMKKMQEGMGKGEKGSSEQFARMAAKQAALRKALRDLAKKKQEQGKGDQSLEPLIEEMDKIETELVNKRLTNEMLRRQKEILTRLLEAEKAEQQREMDEERKSNTAQQIERIVPPEIEEYLKQREAEIESFQTVSPSLRPYYKFLVEEYYDALKRQ